MNLTTMIYTNAMESEDKVFRFRDEVPNLYGRARAITRDMDILAKIHNNIKLFTKIYNSGCLIFVELVRAIYTINTLPDETLLIHFTEIDLYGIFTHDQYLHFIKNLNDEIEDHNINVNLYQIVISGKKQKLVFACTDINYFEKLQNYARECFQSNITNSSNQITIDIVTQSENEIADSYNKLYNYINNRRDYVCCESMKQIQLINDMNYYYRKYSINDTLESKTKDDLFKLIRTASHVVINGNINIGNNNINGNGNIINKIINDESDNWIKNNPPNEHESTSAYYTRYKQSGGKDAANKFGPKVKTSGFRVIQSTGGRVYTTN